MKKYFQNVQRGVMKSRSSYIGAILIVALGIMVYIAMNGFVYNLKKNISGYYDQTSFADVFATVQGMPSEKLAGLEGIDGIRTASGRISAEARLQDENSDEIVTFHLIGCSDEDKLNKVALPGNETSVTPESLFISSAMNKYRGFKQGDPVRLIVGGKSREFIFQGEASEPEYLNITPDAAAATADDEHYGLGVIDETTLQNMTGRNGMVTELGFELQNGYSFEDVQNELQQALSPYGLTDLSKRYNQSSDAQIRIETDQYTSAGTILPLIFIGCSMFMLYIILKKLIDKDRTLIGTMKAMGAYDSELLKTYLFQAVVIGLAGSLIGILAAGPIGNFLLQDDLKIYGLPEAPYESGLMTQIFAVGLSVGACLLTVYLAVREIMKINPADSMRAPEPNVKGKFKLPPWLEKILNVRMVIGLRSIFRNPMRSVITIAAIAVSFGMIASFTAYRGVLNTLYGKRYSKSDLYDVGVILNEPKDMERAMESFAGLSYVRESEAAADFTVQYRNGNRSVYDTLLAIRENTDMILPTDQDGRVHPVSGNGLMMDRKLANKLGVSEGDVIEVNNGALTDKPVELAVTDILDNRYDSGYGCYMDISSLGETFGTGNAANMVFLKMDLSGMGDLKKVLKKSANVSFFLEKERMRISDEESVSMTKSMMLLFDLFAIFMGVVMITNITGISIRERRNEFGTLMILGTTQKEVNEIIIFEHGMDFVLGILIGLPLVRVFDRIVEFVISSDALTLKMQTPPAMCVLSFVICLVIVTASTALVIRNVKNIELPDILKERG